VVRLVRPPKLAGVHGYRWTVRLGISVARIQRNITGNEDPAVRKAARDSGCIALLTKPFSAQELMEPLKRGSAT